MNMLAEIKHIVEEALGDWICIDPLYCPNDIQPFKKIQSILNNFSASHQEVVEEILAHISLPLENYGSVVSGILSAHYPPNDLVEVVKDVSIQYGKIKHLKIPLEFRNSLEYLRSALSKQEGDDGEKS